VLPRVVELLHRHSQEIDKRIVELTKLKHEITAYISRIEEKLESA
jgi:hypothetical protein